MSAEVLSLRSNMIHEDLSRIFVRQSDGRFVEARYRNLAYPPVSWWEWKHAKKRLRDQGRRELQEDVIFAAIAKQRQIEDIAHPQAQRRAGVLLEGLLNRTKRKAATLRL
jgi:hypothetical protein